MSLSKNRKWKKYKASIKKLFTWDKSDKDLKEEACPIDNKIKYALKITTWYLNREMFWDYLYDGEKVALFNTFKEAESLMEMYETEFHTVKVVEYKS